MTLPASAAVLYDYQLVIITTCTMYTETGLGLLASHFILYSNDIAIYYYVVMKPHASIFNF